MFQFKTVVAVDANKNIKTSIHHNIAGLKLSFIAQYTQDSLLKDYLSLMKTKKNKDKYVRNWKPI